MIIFKAYAHHSDSDPLFAFRLPDSIVMAEDIDVVEAIITSNRNLWWGWKQEDDKA